jgi:hypothetical protein
MILGCFFYYLATAFAGQRIGGSQGYFSSLPLEQTRAAAVPQS